MKKIGLLCAAVLLCGGLAGCGNHQQQSNKDATKISKLKAENSSLKAKKHSSHRIKHHRKVADSSSQTNDSIKGKTTTNSSNNGNGRKEDAKEAQARKALHDYDPEWWDSLSPEEQQYWAHHTAYVDNEDFMYDPDLYARHAYPVFGDDDSQNNSGDQGNNDYGNYDGNSQNSDIGFSTGNSGQ